MKKQFGLILLLAYFNCFSFRPVGHVLLKDHIVEQLPNANVFKIAMKEHPQIAAWGSVGPDLAYNIDFSRFAKKHWKKQMKNSWQMSEVAHYHLVGSFLKNLVNEALSTNDSKFIAFVGGWITHVAGDFASHGIYVKPYAGYYISNAKTRDLHGTLEKLADAYLFDKYAKTFYPNCNEFNAEVFWNSFFGTNVPLDSASDAKLQTMLGNTVQNKFNHVFLKTFELDSGAVNLVDLARTYYRAVGKGLGKYTGSKFKQFTIVESRRLLFDSPEGIRKRELIDSAFNSGIEYGTSFLLKNGSDLKHFSDSWNLDVGADGMPTYNIKIDVGDKRTARTKNNLDVYLIDTAGLKSKKFRLTTEFMYLKFTYYEKDSYIYAFYAGGKEGEIARNWTADRIAEVRFVVRPRFANIYPNYLRVKALTVFYDGKVIAKKKADTKDSLITLSNWRTTTLYLEGNDK